MSLSPLLILLVPGFPLVVVTALMLNLFQRTALLLAPLAALPALIISLISAPVISLELPWLLFGSSLGINEIGRIFLLFSSLLWLVAGIYAAGYFSNPASKARFFVWFLFAMAGNLGLILAEDMAIFFTFFTLMSFASYGLVVFDGTVEALRAGRIYIILVVLGEVLLFAGFVLAASASAGHLDFEVVRQNIAGSIMQDWIIGLVLLGFGVKAGVIGLHVWLPLAHPVAPTPASAVLSGSMIAAGLLGWLRMLPMGEAALPGWGGVMVVAGLISVYYAVLVGLVQHKTKTVLAYSSISKMGIMTMGVGLGLIAPEYWPLLLAAILVFAAHHGLVKGALFLALGIAAPVSIIQRRLFIAGILLLALSLAGAPLTGGMIAKQLFKFPFMSMTSPIFDWVFVLFTLSAVATTMLMSRFLYLIWPKREVAAAAAGSGQNAVMRWSWYCLLGVVFFLPIVIFFSIEKLHWPAYFSQSILLSSIWPIVAGGVVALFGVFLHRRKINISFSIPPGDVLFFAEKAVYSFLALIKSSAQAVVSKNKSLMNYILSRRVRNFRLIGLFDDGEKNLLRWNITSALLLVLGLAIAVILVY